MIDEKTAYTYAASFLTPSTSSDVHSEQNDRLPDDQPPRKPDWLLILIGALFLLTVLIAWLADIPVLFQ